MQYCWLKQFAAVCFLTSVFLAFVMGPYGIPKTGCRGYQGVRTFLTGAATPVYFHLAAAQMKHVTARILMNGCQDLLFSEFIEEKKIFNVLCREVNLKG